tara:strand:- start:2368 stop:2628 length:261 start_codon:yes stop_codon:yes gene_type:complete
MSNLPMSFEWQMPVWIETADVDIEVNYCSVEIEVTDFEADTSVTFNQALLEECLDMDDLYTLRRICVAVIEAREQRASEEKHALET